MIIQPFQLSEDVSVEADVCIIGSGAGGSLAASRLAENGHSIVILEEGPFVRREDLNQDEKNLLKRLYQQQASQATDDMSIRILQGRVFGGSPTINWMTCLRTPDHVLEEWIRDFGLEEYSPKVMTPHFDRIEERMKVHTVPDEDHNPQNRLILDGARALGIHAAASQNNSDGCIGCGYCGTGCYYDAKQDMRLTYLGDALKGNTTVYTGVRAEKIHYRGSDEQVVVGVSLGHEYGVSPRTVRVSCRRVVVAGSAIGTPIILQKSKLTKNRVLGKFLHLHPVTIAIGKYDRLIDPSYGIPQSTWSEEYWNLNGEGYGFWVEVAPVQPILGGINLPGMGEERREIVRNLRRLGVMIVLVRDGADKISSGEVKWTRGRKSIRYRLSPTDKKHLLMGLENAIDLQFAAGAKEVYTLHVQFTKLSSPNEIPKIRKLRNGPNELPLFSAHPTGTARMGVRPSHSVVGPTLEMHDYPGIFIMDGSVLPTAPGVNPMITILGVVSRGYELSDNLGL